MNFVCSKACEKQGNVPVQIKQVELSKKNGEKKKDSTTFNSDLI
jgi:hypothetical protein